MSDFLDVAYELGATPVEILKVDKKTRTVIEKIYDYGMFMNNLSKSFSSKKDLVSEGFTNTYYNQVRFDTRKFDQYLIFNERKYFLSEQSNYYQLAGGSTLDHYVYACREVIDDFEDITN